MGKRATALRRDVGKKGFSADRNIDDVVVLRENIVSGGGVKPYSSRLPDEELRRRFCRPESNITESSLTRHKADVRDQPHEIGPLSLLRKSVSISGG